MAALARLSFWVPAARLADFEDFYDHHLAPILRQHGLAEAAQRGRPTVAGVFSRLFEVESPTQIAPTKKALQRDPAWQEALRKASSAIEAPSLLPQYHLGIYSTLCGPGRTGEVGPGFRQGVWQNFNVQDGLFSPEVLDLLQDRTGNLWFATIEGICRYDGAQFTTFTAKDGLVANLVGSLLEDRQGHLWFGTSEGASRYDGHQFTTFTAADGLPDNGVSALLEDREGNLWFGTLGGASRYDGMEFTPFTTADGLADNGVSVLLEDQEGNLWFGTQEGVSRYDGKEFVTFTTADGLVDNRMASLLEDRQGNLWFGTQEGVSRYDGKQFTTFTTAEGLTHNWVTSLLEDQQGYLWLGDSIRGLSRYDGCRFVPFSVGDGLVNNQITSMLEDQEGHLWFGTCGGVSRYDGAQFTTFTTKEGLANDGVMCLLEDRKGRLWSGTWGGVNRCDGNDLVPFTKKNVRSMVEDRDGNLWFGGWGGLSRYDGAQFTPFTQEDGLPVFDVQAMVEDRQGYLWLGGIGGKGGVSRYDGEQFITFRVEDGLADNTVCAILEDRQGHLWFGTGGSARKGAGVSRYDGVQFTTFTTDEGLAHNTVCAIIEDRQGHLWFGTQGGVSRYDGEGFTTFTIADGLANSWVLSLLEDRRGHLWFGTFGGGISLYDGLVFQHLSRKDGLPHDAVQDLLQDHCGDIWIATEGGIVRYRPSHTPPSVRLTAAVADRRYEPAADLQLPGSQKLVAFEFQGRSMTTSPDSMAYVYRLEGFDDGWKTTRECRVEYQDLALGGYTFQVQAVDRDLNYSEPVSVHLTVVPDPHLEALAQVLSGNSEEFVGESAALTQVQAQLEQVARTDLTTLILGETGTGKGLAARRVHRLSLVATGPFVQVNCGAIPEGLVESELFGHERGAFTGAVSRKIGKVELAQGGTLFLDEIGDLQPAAQAKLLQVLEERTFMRVGGTETLRAEVRVIAATNRELRQMVAAGTFREDLYFRLHGFQVELPPLRQRQGDIPALASYFAVRMAAHLNKRITHFTKEALAALSAYSWPGNVRELEHVVKRAVVVCATEVIGVQDLFLGSGEGPGAVEPSLTLEEAERRHILQVLEQTGGIIKGPTGAAALLGVPASTLYGRMKKLGIHRS